MPGGSISVAAVSLDAAHRADMPTCEIPDIAASTGGQTPTASTTADPASPTPGKSTTGIGRLWQPADYAPFVTGGGAVKLSTSAVAPLVAVARGSETVEYVDAKATAKECRRLGIDKRTGQGRRFASSLDAGDILIMPWYLPDHVSRAGRAGTEPQITSIQYRPSRPECDETGRERKYEFVRGADTILGAHPATPADWFDTDTIPLLVAEGQLKADASLTAALVSAGVTAEQLGLEAGETVSSARMRLRNLTAALPDDRRVCIIAIAGVWNYRANPEWSTVGLRDRHVWVAVDGDVSSKWQVWQATEQLFAFLTRRNAHPRLLAPVLATHDGDAKVGVDDYLADYGSWDQLLAQLSDTLPPQPHRDDFDKIGQYRISEDGTQLQVCKARVDPQSGDPVGGDWVTEFPIGGRVVATTCQRDPTPEESRTGIFGAGLDLTSPGVKETVEVEVSWRDDEDSIQTATVHGPAVILGQPPDRWDRTAGVHIPSKLFRNPDWPPEGPLGREWRKAVKSHRRDEWVERTTWTRMGWVPTANDIPVFLVGRQAIGEQVEGSTVSAVSTLIGNAELFGVGKDEGSDWGDPDYRRGLAEDLKTTIDTYLDAYSDPAFAATAIAAALRPVLPPRPITTVYLVGPPGSGKSFTAGAICGFWSAYPGAWDGDALPGSAKDSIAATEANLSASHIWVVDDLAPSSDHRKATQEQAAIDDIVRSVFNGRGRGRMNADGTPRYTRNPHALLVATAENDSPVASIRNRTVALRFRKGSLPESRTPTDDLNELYRVNGAPARVTQGLIRFLRWHAAETHGGDWELLVRSVEDLRQDTERMVTKLIKQAGYQKGDTARAIGLGTDLVLALVQLAAMARELGLDADYPRMLAREDGLPAAITRLVVSGWEEHTRTTPGKNLIAAISALVRSGRAYIRALDPKAVPGEAEGLNVAAALGWRASRAGGDLQTPSAPAIGVLTIRKDTSEPVVLLEHLTAFELAQQHFSQLVPPGSRPTTSWQSARDDGLIVTDMLPAPDHGSVTARRRIDGQRVSGVPVALNVLVNGELDPTEGRPAGADVMAAEVVASADGSRLDGPVRQR